MFKKIYLKIIVLALLVGPSISAQEIMMGPIYEFANVDYSNRRIVQVDEENIYLADYGITTSSFGPTKRLVLLECFDKSTLKMKYQKELVLDLTDPRDTFSVLSYVQTRLQQIYFMEDRVVYFVSSFNYKLSYSEMRVHQYDIKTNEELPVTTLMHTKIEKGPAMQNSRKFEKRKGYYNIQVNEDETKFFIQYVHEEFAKAKKYDHLYVFDRDFKLIKDKEFILKEEEEVTTSNVIVDNEGSVYYIDEDEFVFRDLFQDFEEWREPIPTEGFASNAKATYAVGAFDPAGDLVLIAQYQTEDLEKRKGNKKRSNLKKGDTQVEGVVFMRADGFNKEVKDLVVSKFDDSFIDEFKDEIDIEKGFDAEVKNTFTRFKFHFHDSLIYLIGEQYIRDEDGRHYDDLVVYCFEPSGKLKWSHRIPKDQVKVGDDLWSGGYMSYPDYGHLYILIHDEEENIENNKRVTEKVRELEDDQYAIPILYKFDLKTGEFDYEVKKDWVKNEDLKINPRYSFRAKKGEPIYTIVRNRDEYCLARIRLE